MTCLSNEERVIALLKEEKRISGGHCGLYPVAIKNTLGLPWEELREILNKLYKDKKIIICTAIHGKLIKLK